MYNFIIVDDSELCITLYETILRKLIKNARIRSFIRADKALQYIEEEYGKPENVSTLLLLDIHMPIMDGLEFLEKFANLKREIQANFKIAVVSSYAGKNEIKKALSYSRVITYIEKPFTIQALKQLIEDSGYTAD